MTWLQHLSAARRWPGLVRPSVARGDGRARPRASTASRSRPTRVGQRVSGRACPGTCSPEATRWGFARTGAAPALRARAAPVTRPRLERLATRGRAAAASADGFATGRPARTSRHRVRRRATSARGPRRRSVSRGTPPPPRAPCAPGKARGSTEGRASQETSRARVQAAPGGSLSRPGAPGTGLARATSTSALAVGHRHVA